MKICPACQMGNSDERVICRECGTSLRTIASQDEETILKAESDLYGRMDERRQRNFKRLKFAVVVLSAVLHISLFVVSIIRGNFFFLSLLLLFMPAAGYMMIVKAEKLFQLKIDASGDYDFTGEVRPTEWFLIKNFIRAVFVILYPIVLMGVIAFH